MAKTARLKSRRPAEARKLGLAAKYAKRGVATGGGRISTKKLRRTIEARNIPLVDHLQTTPKKVKRGRRHTPPSTAPLSKGRRA